MMPRKKGCCCTQTSECREQQPCREYTVALCLQSDAGGCSSLPTFTLTVGPGSTATLSGAFRFVRQDLRVYGVTGESYAPVDPGAFPDDPFDDDCAWDHPYEPDSTTFAHGRKVCKTVLRFTDVVFTWQYSEADCAWVWAANGATVEIGIPATIDETGTAETAETLWLRMEPDATEEVVCNLVLGFPSTIDWCPGREDMPMLLSLAVRRADGEPFGRFFHEDWIEDDGIVGSAPTADYQPFPAPCSEYDPGDPPCDPDDWPEDLFVGGDRTAMFLSLSLLPVGRYQSLNADVDALETPAQTHGEIDDDGSDPWIGYASATGDWINRSGSVSVSIVNRECLPPPGTCTECLAAQAAALTSNGIPFGCTGMTTVELDEDYQPYQPGITSNSYLTRTTNSYQMRLHCDDVGGFKVYRMHLWTRSQVYEAETAPSLVVDTDTDTGWVDSGALSGWPGGSTGTAGPFGFEGGGPGSCSADYTIESGWTLATDADCESLNYDGFGCCDDFATCLFTDPYFEVVWTPGIYSTPCPGPTLSGSVSIAADCTMCPAPSGVWETLSGTVNPDCCIDEFGNGDPCDLDQPYQIKRLSIL